MSALTHKEWHSLPNNLVPFPLNFGISSELTNGIAKESKRNYEDG